MRAGRKRHGLIEEGARPGDNAAAALRIVTLSRRFRSVARNGVGAVKRIVERTPARVRGIQCIARVADRHHELRPGDGCDFGIHIGGVDREGGAFGDEIADVLQKAFVRGFVDVASATIPVPAVDFRLQFVAARQQPAIDRREVVNDAIETLPECRLLDPGAGQDFIDNEIVEDFGDLQPANRDTLDI